MFSQPTQDELDRFHQEYGHLTSVLLGWTVAYGREDEAVLKEAIDDETTEGLRLALEEGRRFLQQKEIPWTVIVDTANYSIPYEKWMHEWLNWILQGIEAAIVAREQSKNESPKTATERTTAS